MYDRFSKPIRFVSAPCSTGKTYAACDYMAENWDISNFLYVAPTLPLLNQTKDNLEARGVKCTLITNETHPNRVKREIISYLKAARSTGHILLVTQQALLGLPYFPRRRAWQVIFDEIPQLDTFYRFKLPINKHLLLEHLTFLPWKNGLYLVSARSTGRLQKLLEQPRDDVLDLFRPLLSQLAIGNHSVCVDQDTFDKLNGSVVYKKGDDERNRVYFLSLLGPSVFDNAIILGANAENTLVYHWLTLCGREFEEHTDIARRLRQAPSIGHRLKILFFVPGRSFSKYLRDQKVGNGTLIDEMDRLAYETLGGEPFLYATNNDRAKPRPEWSNAVPIPVVSHGLNSYAGYHGIYFSAALNREPKHYEMLETVGLSAEVIDRATSQEVTYQSVMRTSLRDPDSQEKVVAIVPDEPSARTLSALTACDCVAQLGNLVTSKPSPLTSNQKAQRARAKKIQDLLNAPNPGLLSLIEDFSIDFGEFLRGGHSQHCIVTLHKSPYARTRDEHAVQMVEVQTFIKWLRQLSATVINGKEDNSLFTPAVFNPSEGAGGYRKKEHFVLSSFMVLDFDGGQVSPEIFEEVFWSKAKKGTKTSFVICNTFSRSPEELNKFRVIMFYRRPAISIEEHQEVFDWIERRLEEAGYSSETSGLDQTVCRSGVQSFYLPCTNRMHPDWAFFRQWGTKTRELRRCGLDPEAIAPRRPRKGAARHGGGRKAYNSEAIQKAISRLHAMPDGRRPVFFQIGLMYACQGLSLAEVEYELEVVAGLDTRLLDKIPEVIKSLVRYGWLKG